MIDVEVTASRLLDALKHRTDQPSRADYVLARIPDGELGAVAMALVERLNPDRPMKAMDRIAPLVEVDLGEDVTTPLTRPDPREVDQAKVWRAMGRERIALTSAERKDAVRRLHARGLTDTQITEVLGVVRYETVTKIRERLGLRANLVNPRFLTDRRQRSKWKTWRTAKLSDPTANLG